jgi:glycosyltransferase involved in cell wall biosynthesis
VKRIVIANLFSAWPPLGGGQRRVFFLARELSKSFDIDLIVLDRSGPFRRLEFGRNFREIRAPAENAYLTELRKIKRKSKSANDLAYVRHWNKCELYQYVLEERLKGAAAVVSAHPYSIFAIGAALRGAEVPVIYDAHNVEAHQKRELLGAGSPELAEIRQVEAAAVRASALITACSEQDALAFVQDYGADRNAIRIIENGVDAKGVLRMTQEQIAEVRSQLGISGAFVAIFAGSHHFPNFLAVERVVSLAKALPDAVFVILGTICRYAGLQGALPPNVILLGAVDESMKWVAFQIADVGLNPMEQGSGTNIKMLEYAAAGLAIVSTPFGARGIGLNAGSEYIECDFEQFGKCISELASGSRTSLAEMGSRVRERVLEVSDWSAIGVRLVERIVNLLNRI